MIKLCLSTRLSIEYVKALTICRHTQPEIWDLFCSEIPISRLFLNKFVCFFATTLYFTYFKSIRNSKYIYLNYWNNRKGIITERLDDLFEYKLKENVCRAYICVTPVYTRNVIKQSFLLPTNASEQRVLEIIIHEILHFYFYQNESVSQYDQDCIWKISELIVPIVIENFFLDICSTSVSYVGELTLEQKLLVNKWIKKECSLDEMLKIFIEREDVSE